jgi:1-acyl-sn-glycerol-3-phosphate acyltransferase
MERYLWAGGLVFVSGIRVTIKGLEDVDWSKPYVIMSNHESFFDILIYMAMFPTWIRWVAKKSLFEIPFLGWSMWARKDIPLDRRNLKASIKSLAKAAQSLLKGGRSVVNFPKGTRGKTENIGPFKKGPFMLAILSQCAILPVVIKGTRNVLKKGSLLINPCDVEVWIGQPIETKELVEKDRDHLMHRVHNVMSNAHKAMGGVGGDPKNVIAKSGFKGKKESLKFLITMRIANATTIVLTFWGIIYLLLKAVVGV